eukprot:Amastigsp_a517960_16.p2 type:complete len:204 gc:universal Amastigsp_a517960_16:855-244(-)
MRVIDLVRERERQHAVEPTGDREKHQERHTERRPKHQRALHTMHLKRGHVSDVARIQIVVKVKDLEHRKGDGGDDADENVRQRNPRERRAVVAPMIRLRSGASATDQRHKILKAVLAPEVLERKGHACHNGEDTEPNLKHGRVESVLDQDAELNYKAPDDKHPNRCRRHERKELVGAGPYPHHHLQPEKKIVERHARRTAAAT